MTTSRWRYALAAALIAYGAPARAHDGPPFPILSGHSAGPYLVAIWTDPDTTDDGSAGGQFWITLQRAGDRSAVPAGTRATVTVVPAGSPDPPRSADAEPVRGDIANQFAAVVLDREGRFAVRVSIEGPLGPATAEATVDATYGARPPRYLLAVYLAPFVLVGGLWLRLMRRRRTHSALD